MGNINCTDMCMKKLHVEFEQITNQPLSHTIVKLQSLVRKYLTRKKYMKVLFDIHQQHWDLVFKNVKGLVQFNEKYIKHNLRYFIINFYTRVFSIDLTQKKYILNENHYNFNEPELFLSNFRPLILQFMNKNYYLGKLRKGLKDVNVEYEIDDNLFEKLECSLSISDKSKATEVSYTNITVESHQLTYTKKQTAEQGGGSILNSARKSSFYAGKNTLDLPTRNDHQMKTVKLYNNFYRDSLFNSKIKFILHEASTKEEEYNHTIPNKSTLNSENDYYGRIRLIDSHGRLVFENNLEEIDSTPHITKTTFDRDNGIYYTGQWSIKSQCKSRFGVQYSSNWVNGIRYKYMGYFRNNLFHGYGILIREDGLIYQGEFRDGKVSGFGIEIINEKVYQGFFMDGKYHGYGELVINGTTKYKGCFNMGVRDNIGWSQNDDGTKYIGNYTNGKVNEFGSFLWKEGHIYYGQWKSEKMDGKGKFKWNNGDLFIGYYNKDIKNGDGEYYFAEKNSILKGTWQMGKKHGKFHMYKDGEKYFLVYKNDQQIS
jgi:hypothetical protein